MGTDDGLIGRMHRSMRHWFDKQQPEEQVRILKPSFSDAHPTDADVKRAYRESTGEEA